MKILADLTRTQFVNLTTLDGKLDSQGNIETISKVNDWSLVSEKGGVDHFIKTNRFNNLRAKHKFVNNTQVQVTYKWTIHIITSSGQRLKYDFGTETIKAGATRFSVSVPYKYSKLLSEDKVSKIMVALMIV